MTRYDFVEPEGLAPSLIRAYRDLFNTEIGGGVGFAEAIDDAEAEAWLRRFAAPPNRLLLAWQGELLVGAAAMMLMASPVQRHVAEMRKMLVHPTARRGGIARQLMRRLEAAAREQGLRSLVAHVRAHLPVRGLLRSLGYDEVGVLREMSRVGEQSFDIVIYQKMLSP